MDTAGLKANRKVKGQAEGLTTGSIGIGRLLLALIIIATVIVLLEQARNDRNHIKSQVDQGGGVP